MKKLNVTVQCMAVYNSTIEVPEDMSLEDALDYAEAHLDEIPLGALEYVRDSDQLDRENCDFDDFDHQCLLGKNSTGYQVVLVEFEDVNVDFKLKNFNAETESVRKGLAQIRDWKRWMDDNRRYFFDSCSLSFIREGIPSWGIHYCLVVGRRSRMDDISREMRAQLERETPGLHIVSYDRLVDNIKLLTNGF